MSKPLTNDAILAMLQDEASKPKRGGGARVDHTLDRSYQNWYKQNHHMCLSDCPHRQAEGNVNHFACWNPECKDPRPREDFGTNIVVEVYGQFVCRFCWLAGYLLPGGTV